MIDFIIAEKGEEVISERHQKDYKKEYQNGQPQTAEVSSEATTQSFTDIDFDDI